MVGLGFQPKDRACGEYEYPVRRRNQDDERDPPTLGWNVLRLRCRVILNLILLT